VALQATSEAAAASAAAAALTNASRLLAAGRLLYKRAEFQPTACSLLALAHEELGKSILFQVIAEGKADLHARLENANGGLRRLLVDDHGGKFDLAVGVIVHEGLENAVIDAFEHFLHRHLSGDECRTVGSSLLGNRIRRELTEGGVLSAIESELGSSRANSLVMLVGEMTDWATSEYDVLASIKLRGLYVDFDPESSEILTPEGVDLPDFRLLATRLESAIQRLRTAPVRPSRDASS